MLAKTLFHSHFALVLLVSSAAAVPVVPGGSAFLPGTTLAGTPALDGSVGSNLSSLLDFDPSPLGLQGYVVASEARNSDSAGTTIISHQFTNPVNIVPSFLLIDGFSLTGFAGFATDVFFRTDATGDRAPTTVARSADGDVLDFTFGFPLVNGYLIQQVQEISFPIEILTDADSFENTGRMTVSGRLLDDTTNPVEMTLTGLPAPFLTPAAPVPLPTSSVLLLLALAGFVVPAWKHGAG